MEGGGWIELDEFRPTKRRGVVFQTTYEPQIVVQCPFLENKKKEETRAPTAAQLEGYILTKLLRGWSRSDTRQAMALAGLGFPATAWYNRLRELREGWPVKDIDGVTGLGGACVENAAQIHDKALQYYSVLDLIDLPQLATYFLSVIYLDGRNLWGKNELIAWMFRQVLHKQSPDNVWPILLAKVTGAESFPMLYQLDTQAGISESVREVRGSTVTVNGRVLEVAVPILGDWMSLLPIMNNCDLPSAHPLANGDDPCICGLCGWASSMKKLTLDGSGAELYKVWSTYSLDAPEWLIVPHLFGAGPQDIIWEPLHLINRATDIVLKHAGQFLPSSTFGTLYHDVTGSIYKDGRSLILKDTKAFYAVNGWDTVIRTLAARGGEAAEAARLFDGVSAGFRYFWRLIHSNYDDAFTQEEYWERRSAFLTSLRRLRLPVFTPALHYLTNHLWENYQKWGALEYFIGEAGEASHARDNRMKWPTLRGRRCNGDPCNSWCLMLRNFYSLKTLLMSKVFDS